MMMSSEVFEQLIEDPAFQKATSFVAPGIPFDMLAEKFGLVRRS